MGQNDQPVHTASSLLDYYHKEVVPALATAVTLSHKFPQEVLNELRNAMTHMGRANALDPNAACESAQKELHAARRHLLRCTLDCLKVVLLSLAKGCESRLNALDDELVLPQTIHNSARELRRRRIEVSTHEGQKPVEEVVEKLKILCDDYDKFSQQIDSEFSGDVVLQRRQAVRKAKWIERGWGFLAGVVASAIGALIFG